MPKGPSYLLILLMVGAVLAIGSAAMLWERYSPDAYITQVEPVRPGQENSLRQAVFASDRLWLLSDAGQLWTVDEATRNVGRSEVPEPVVGLCANHLGIATVQDHRAGSQAWAIHRQMGQDWHLVAEVEKMGEGLVGLVCDQSALILITSGRLVSVNAQHQTTLRLASRIPARPTSTILSTPTKLFVGLSEGEFGGGLMVIDRRTGAVREVSSNTSGELCGGPLNPDCDPVNGLTMSPWRADCVVAAIGLLHLGAHGRLIEVCDDQVTRIYVGPCPVETDGRGYADGEPYCTEPMFGAVAIGSSVIAVGYSGVMAVDGRGVAQLQGEPRYERYGPFEVHFGSDLIFIMSSANRRTSLGPDTPMLLARR